jgi:hypothetical protein
VRLSENRIKEAILDTDLEIRQRAIRFFAKSFSSDTSVMPLVIKWPTTNALSCWRSQVVNSSRGAATMITRKAADD